MYRGSLGVNIVKKKTIKYWVLVCKKFTLGFHEEKSYLLYIPGMEGV